MSFAFVLGNIMSRVVLTIVYLVIILPIGFLKRLAGHDVLRIRKPQMKSYWGDVKQPTEKQRYERQF